MVKKTYKELLDSLKYSDLGYTGERKPLTDPKYKQFTDTINKNAVIANTHIDSSLPTMPQAQVNGQGTVTDPTIPTAKVDGKNPWAKNRRNAGFQDPKGAEVSTVGSETTVGGATPETVPTTDTPLTIDAKYSDFTKWAKEHGVDSDKVFQDAMALARSQYEQARSTYGLQAEQLAQAGLTNSGVSDNMERVAYAQKVQAEQAALDQKAALDQANKQGFAQYQEQQKQKQQQYTNLYQQLVDGYEDEYGNIHAAVSPEMAIAQLKFAGLTDETMIAEAQKAYGAYKSVYDKEQADRQNAIAGLDTTTDADGNTTVNGFSADSMLGKLFDGTWDSEDFLDQIQKDYGVRFNTDEEAVDALLDKGVITKEQSSMFYRNIFNTSLEAIAEAHQTPEEMLESSDSDFYTAVIKAKEAYDQGKLSKEDWDAFRKSIMNGKADVSIKAKAGENFNNIEFTITVGRRSESFVIPHGSNREVSDKSEERELNKLADGAKFVVKDDKLYVKVSGDWIRFKPVSSTKRSLLKDILKILAEPTKKHRSLNKVK